GVARLANSENAPAMDTAKTLTNPLEAIAKALAERFGFSAKEFADAKASKELAELIKALLERNVLEAAKAWNELVAALRERQQAIEKEQKEAAAKKQQEEAERKEQDRQKNQSEKEIERSIRDGSIDGNRYDHQDNSLGSEFRTSYA